ncbi:MAG: type II toxin-antitoxin system VapC family toxin [bacterium]|nr:type II toxin-antitoxin system VapC family toxin [bacterium]MCY4134255.1 type II toxin-antitoxin system VapC family toxin [bacterium]
MILLDTHILLWLVTATTRLGTVARNEIQGAWDRGEAAVSSFTFWELALHYSKGRLELDTPPRILYRNWIADGLRTVPVDDEIAMRSVELGADGFHPDPADRVITATAILGGYRLATADRAITEWAERTRLVSILEPET